MSNITSKRDPLQMDTIEIHFADHSDSNFISNQ